MSWQHHRPPSSPSRLYRHRQHHHNNNKHFPSNGGVRDPGAERERREAARREARARREMAGAESHSDKSQSSSTPKFNIVKREDPTGSLVQQVLGDYEDYKNSVINPGSRAHHRENDWCTPDGGSSSRHSSSSSSSSSSRRGPAMNGTTRSRGPHQHPPPPSSLGSGGSSLKSSLGQPESAHAKPNGNVKDSLKSGPGPGPGGGTSSLGGRHSMLSMGGRSSLPPLKLDMINSGGSGGGGGGVGGPIHDPDIRKIMSEMTINNPLSAILQTPRHDHQDSSFVYPITPIKTTPVKQQQHVPSKPHKDEGAQSRMGKSSERNGGYMHMNRNGDSDPDLSNQLHLSEASDEEPGPGSDFLVAGSDCSIGAAVIGVLLGSPPNSKNRGSGAGLGKTATLQSFAQETATPKTSDGSSNSSESEESDSDGSSDSSDEDEERKSEVSPQSPKPQEEKASDDWNLGKTYLAQKKISDSPTTQEAGNDSSVDVKGSNPVGRQISSREDEGILDTKAPPANKRGSDRRPNKVSPFVNSHRSPRSLAASESSRVHRSKPKLSSSSGESSDEEVKQPRRPPLPRISVSAKAANEFERPKAAAGPRSKPVCSLGSDSDDDEDEDDDDDDEVPAPVHRGKRTGGSRANSASSVASKNATPKSSKVLKPLGPTLEPARKPRKRNDSAKKKTASAVGEGKRRKNFPSQEIVRQDTDSDEDCEVDIITTTPEKNVPARVPPASNHRTPPKAPQESPCAVPSPTKSPAISANRISPMPSRNVTPQRKTPKDSKSVNEKSSEEAPLSESIVSTQRFSDDELPTTGKNRTSPPKIERPKEKNAVVDKVFSKLRKDKDSVAKDRKLQKDEVGGGRSRRKSKETGVRDRSADKEKDSENSCDVSDSVDRSGSAWIKGEPKVPIPNVQYVDGVPKLLCRLPLSLLNKLPNSIQSPMVDNKDEVKKEVLELRTIMGKGKRKDVNSKSSPDEYETKSKVLTSIYRTSKRQSSHEPDLDSVKKEIKVEAWPNTDKDFGDGETKPTVKEEPYSTPSGSHSDRRSQDRDNSSASSPHHLASKKHKNKVKRKEPRGSPKKKSNKESSSAGLGADSGGGVQGSGSQRDASSGEFRDVEMEMPVGLSRKRDHEPDISQRGEKETKRPRLGDLQEPGVGTLSPHNAVTATAASATTVQISSHTNEEDTWSEEKESSRYSKYPERSGMVPQSSQYSQEEYGGYEEVGGRHSMMEVDTRITYHNPHHSTAHHKQEEDDQSVVEYISLPSSEHEPVPQYRPGEEQTGPSPDPYRMAPRYPPQHISPLTHYQHPSGSRWPQQQQPQQPQHVQRQRVYMSYFERHQTQPETYTDQNQCLNQAKHLKHSADRETDRTLQAMYYLEAVLYFILTGKAMETDPSCVPAALTMYKDTLNLIKWISSKFRRENQTGNINWKLAVLSLRCQSLLSLKIYKLKQTEVKDNQRQLQEYFSNYTKMSALQNTVEERSSSGPNSGSVAIAGGTAGWGGPRTTGTPSPLSPTPSPAGSVGSDGSQSSGYASSTEGARRGKGGQPTPPHPQPPTACAPNANTNVAVPKDIHALLAKQNQLTFYLANAHDMWSEADSYVLRMGIKEFFIDLDHVEGPLTLHSSLFELVNYVRAGLGRLKEASSASNSSSSGNMSTE